MFPATLLGALDTLASQTRNDDFPHRPSRGRQVIVNIINISLWCDGKWSVLWKGKEGAGMKGGRRDMVAVFIMVVRKALARKRFYEQSLQGGKEEIPPLLLPKELQE